MNKTKDIVIGLGEIGKPLLQLLSTKDLTIGYDINSKLMDTKKFQKFKKLETRFLHVCIPFTNNFEKNVIKFFKKFHPTIIVIHSTIKPNTTKSIQQQLPIPILYSAIRGVHKRMIFDMKKYVKFFSLEKNAPNKELASKKFVSVMKRAKIKTKKMSNPLTLELAKIICDTSYLGWLINYAQISNMVAIRHGVNYDEMWSFSDEIHKSLSLAELARKNRQLQDANRKLEAMARTDDLTGLYNRRYFGEQLDRAWAQAVRNDRPLAFMMIDLDRLKETNDRFGHQRGDEVLRRAARVIEANCRQVDVTARYGGDEFCVLMPHTDVQEAVRVAERILHEYESANGVKSKNEPRLGMSIGIAHIDLSRPANAEQLIRHADEAMYAAKSDAASRAVLRDADGVYAPSSGERIAAPDYRRSNEAL